MKQHELGWQRSRRRPVGGLSDSLSPACPQQAVLRHASPFVVDLLVARVPEVPRGMIEAVGQPVAGGGSFQQGGKQGVLNGHGSLWCAGCSVCPRPYQTRCKDKMTRPGNRWAFRLAITGR